MPSIGTVKAPAMVPSGGSAGQYLIKNPGTTDYDAGWQTVPATTGPGRIYTSGQWYDLRIQNVNNATASGYNSLAVGASCYMPVWIGAPIRITGLALLCPTGSVTSGSSTGQLGVSTMNTATGAPGTLLDSVTVTANFSQGVLTGTVAATIPSAGWYFLGIGCTGAALGASSASGGVQVPSPFSRTVANPVYFGVWGSTTAGGVLSSNPTVTANTNATGSGLGFGINVFYQVG